MAERYLKFKGFRDVHVHFRDPGMPIAETRRSGAAAAAAGGFTCVTTMPNTTPAGDSVEWLREQIEDASLPVRIAPSACISKGVSERRSQIWSVLPKQELLRSRMTARLWMTRILCARPCAGRRLLESRLCSMP